MNFSNQLSGFNPSPFIDDLKIVFQEMEAAYNHAADGYDFKCSGCEESCCLTLFYHHTLLEHIYLELGFQTLAPEMQQQVIEKAEDVVRMTDSAIESGRTPRFMCPLNSDGLCVLYEYRPMVCRLHGIEHELTRPGTEPVRSPGCELFTESTKGMGYIPFDRTPHYIAMAKLERTIREATGYNLKLKHTIAEMLLL